MVRRWNWNIHIPHSAFLLKESRAYTHWVIKHFCFYPRQSLALCPCSGCCFRSKYFNIIGKRQETHWQTNIFLIRVSVGKNRLTISLLELALLRTIKHSNLVFLIDGMAVWILSQSVTLRWTRGHALQRKSCSVNFLAYGRPIQDNTWHQTIYKYLFKRIY